MSARAQRYLMQDRRLRVVAPTAVAIPVAFRVSKQVTKAVMSNASRSRSPSLASSAPPTAAQQFAAADLASEHPLWARARGAGQGSSSQHTPQRRGAAAAAAAADPSGEARFEPISARFLEDELNADADGAQSELSDDEESRVVAADRSDDELDDDAAEEEARKHRSNRLSQMATAAFGGNTAFDNAPSHAGTASEASSRGRRRAQKAVFGTRTVRCVGCALGSKIACVDSFIAENSRRMREESMFKFAALLYKREVMEPAAKEGAYAPAWTWRGVRTHYTVCCTSNDVARQSTVRTLQELRQLLRGRLVRVGEGDRREVDKQTADLLLKTIQAESRERVLMEQGEVGTSSARRRGA